MIRSILHRWSWRSTWRNTGSDTKGLLLMESISGLTDATLRSWWLHSLCPQAPCIRRPFLPVFVQHLPLSLGKLEVNCHSWRESTFNLEEAIRGGLLSGKCHGRGGQNWQATKHASWVKGQAHYVVPAVNCLTCFNSSCKRGNCRLKVTIKYFYSTAVLQCLIQSQDNHSVYNCTMKRNAIK